MEEETQLFILYIQPSNYLALYMLDYITVTVLQTHVMQ